MFAAEEKERSLAEKQMVRGVSVNGDACALRNNGILGTSLRMQVPRLCQGVTYWMCSLRMAGLSMQVRVHCCVTVSVALHCGSSGKCFLEEDIILRERDLPHESQWHSYQWQLEPCRPIAMKAEYSHLCWRCRWCHSSLGFSGGFYQHDKHGQLFFLSMFCRATLCFQSSFLYRLGSCFLVVLGILSSVCLQFLFLGRDDERKRWWTPPGVQSPPVCGCRSISGSPSSLSLRRPLKILSWDVVCVCFFSIGLQLLSESAEQQRKCEALTQQEVELRGQVRMHVFVFLIYFYTGAFTVKSCIKAALD